LVDEGKDKNDINQIGLKPVRKTAHLETYRVNTKVSKEQMSDIQKLHGMGVIDTTSMFKSVLEKESEDLRDPPVTFGVF
jgi:hypothetical protein